MRFMLVSSESKERFFGRSLAIVEDETERAGSDVNSHLCYNGHGGFWSSYFVERNMKELKRKEI